MIRPKKEIKRVVIVLIFISIVLISNVQLINQSSLLNENINDDNQLKELPNSADLNVSDYITGFGVDQDVRIYVNNESENLNDNQDFFEIPSVTSDDMYLTHGDFEFTFQNNFTTEYILEDDDALYAENFILFPYDKGISGITFHNGSLYDGDLGNWKDGDIGSWVEYDTDPGESVINFTIRANFTGSEFTEERPDVMNGNVEFNRSKILALISSLFFRVDNDVNLTIRIKDFSQPTWKEVISNLRINSSSVRKELTEHFINENLNFIDLTSTCYIQFFIESLDLNPFIIRLYEFDMQSTLAFDFPITDQEYVALEFDLKGTQSTVNGFYAWIRTLDLNEAASTQLNISLYRSNRTVRRDDDDGNFLRTVRLSPNYNEPMIDTKLFNYTNDQLYYFGFNTANTQDLNLSNYFIVIKSTNSKQVYSLVAMPYYDYGEAVGITEHQLIITEDYGVNWKFSKKEVETDEPGPPYTNYNLDASSFKLNVTRGYMPSDFIFNGNNTLRIQNMTIDDMEDSSYPYNESSYLTWGLGRWNHTFPTPIVNSSTNKFQVDLFWNRSIVAGFTFNITYSVNAYWIDKAIANYYATYTESPEWVLNFDFNKTEPKFNNWNFVEFWYIYPNFMNAHNLTKPKGEEFLWLLDEESVVADSPSNLKLVINKIFSNLTGIYTLNLTSYNFIDEMHTYINYYGSLLETNGFMYGDNISVRVDIQDHNFKAPLIGDVNATLFYPNGTRYPYAELNSSSGFVDESVLSYDFNNNTILEVTKDLFELGKYELGFFWFNGSAIGCKKLPLYIDTYDLELINCTYISYLDSNALSGRILNDEIFQDFTILIASINDTTGISKPEFYPINNSDLNQVYSYNLGGQDLSLLMNSFLQSEDILNPNETVNFKTTIHNTHPFIPLDVTVNIKLVSFINEDWIIAENTSQTINLNFSGTRDDSYEFNMDLTIPNLDVVTNTWEGLNAPVRLGGAKTIVTLFIHDFEVGVFESTDYSLLSNETSNNYEGHILGLTVTEDRRGVNILYEFERDECLYYPDNSSFLVNIIDENYVSSYRQFDEKFSLNLNSKFTNIAITPDSPRTGEIINVSSILTTEFGDELPAKDVTCEYYNSSSWVNIGSDLTDANGSVAFLINTAVIDFDKEEDLTLRLSWDGDIINGISKNITVELIQERNNFSISIKQNDVTIYKSKFTTLRITINNFGDSNLRFFRNNISVIIEGNLLYSIVEINNIELNRLAPDESTEIIIEIKISQIDRLDITFSITAQNILTGENITISKHTSFRVFDTPLSDYFLELFMFIMIAIFALVWILTVTFAFKVRKRIEEPVEKVERRPRKGKYVMVSELKKPAPPKKAPKKKEEAKPEKKTDLDSLLEERGLSDKKKKPKK